MKSISRVLLIAAGLALAPSLASADWRDNHRPAWKKTHHAHQDRRVQHGHHYGHWTPWWAQHQRHRYDWHRWNGARHFTRHDERRRHDFRHFHYGYHYGYKEEPRFIPRHNDDGDRR